MKVEKAPGGTKEKPQLVPSMFSERIVGCICKLYVDSIQRLYSLVVIGLRNFIPNVIQKWNAGRMPGNFNARDEFVLL